MRRDRRGGGHRLRAARIRHDHRKRAGPAVDRLGLRLLRRVRRALPDRFALLYRFRDPRARGDDDLHLLRLRLRHPPGGFRRPARVGAGAARESVQRRPSLREGPFRLLLRELPGPADDAAHPAQRHARGSDLGRSARPGGGAVLGLARRRLRCHRLREADERGKLHHPEVLPRRHGHQQRRPLRAPLSLAVGGGTGAELRQWGDDEFVQGPRRRELHLCHRDQHHRRASHYRVAGHAIDPRRRQADRRQPSRDRTRPLRRSPHPEPGGK